MYKPKIYLSGGFKSKWQNNVKTLLVDKFIFFDPSTHNLFNSDLYTAWDIHFVKECDILFAYMESGNPSGYGLAFELGIAYSLSKTIILIDEKSNSDNTFSKYFKILHRPSNVVFDNLDDGIKFLDSFSLH